MEKTKKLIAKLLSYMCVFPEWKEKAIPFPTQRPCRRITRNGTNTRMSVFLWTIVFPGVTVKRNGFQKMMALVEAGKASAVIVKDLPRLGRNYLEVVQAHGNCFLLHNVHFIAVNNGVDSEQGEDVFIHPFHNIMNEWYAKDMSRKMRSSIRTKSKQGYAIGRPPLGYMHDAENPKLWYEKVLIPSIHAERKGFKKPTRRATRGE